MGYGLEKLIHDCCLDPEGMMRQNFSKGSSPAICTECGYTTDMEPDQDGGWCEVCEKNTVVSGLILAGMI